MKAKKNTRTKRRVRKRNLQPRSILVSILLVIHLLAKSDIIDLDDLKAVLFKRSQLVAYLTNPFFDSLVRNSFVLHRETVGTVLFIFTFSFRIECTRFVKLKMFEKLLRNTLLTAFVVIKCDMIAMMSYRS